MSELRWVSVLALCGLYGCRDKAAGNAAWCNQLLVDACACEATDDDSDLCQDAEAVADSDDDAACRSYYYSSVPAECQTADDGDSGSEVAQAPSDDEGQTDVVPDGVAGRYNNLIAAATGCDGDTHWFEDRFPGPMTVDVDWDLLRFVFSGDLALSGGVEGRSYTVTGSWSVVSDHDDVGGAELDVSITGDLDRGSSGCWTIDGDVEMVVDQDGLESTNCTLVGAMRASQLEGGDCNGTL